MIKFEKVRRFTDVDFNLPVRKTENSAGYDFEVAEDIIVPCYEELMDEWETYDLLNLLQINNMGLTENEISEQLEREAMRPRSLEEMAALSKQRKIKPTLVSTGVKCYLDEGFYLELSVRSSTPLKHWLVLANGIGIIDADYADNEANEGEIFFQLINLSPYPIALKKGDIIGQGIVKKYYLTDNDDLAQSKDKARKRTGGFGSTSERAQ